MTALRSLGYSALGAGLSRSFRRVVWLGQGPDLPDRPVVLYANHHAFHDGQLLAYLVEVVLRRQAVVWMQELNRFPFFKLLGALPFPADSATERASTVRATVRMWRRNPKTTLIYFPEGQLHPWEDGLLWPEDDRMERLKRLGPELLWWPVALKVSGHENHRPTAYLKGGRPHDGTGGAEKMHLEALMRSLDQPARFRQTVLLEGNRGPHERWNLSFLDPVISRLS